MVNEKEKKQTEVHKMTSNKCFFALFIGVQIPPCFEINVELFMNFTDFKNKVSKQNLCIVNTYVTTCVEKSKHSVYSELVLDETKRIIKLNTPQRIDRLSRDFTVYLRLKTIKKNLT